MEGYVLSSDRLIKWKFSNVVRYSDDIERTSGHSTDYFHLANILRRNVNFKLAVQYSNLPSAVRPILQNENLVLPRLPETP
jgi:hypothetical protein